MSVRQQPEDNFVGIGSRLRSERIKIGLNQEDFATSAGTSSQSQMRYETGKQIPKLEYLFALQKLGVDVAFVITGCSADGMLGAFETELLKNFSQLTDEQRSALLMAAEAMADRRSHSASPVDPPFDQLQAAFTIAQALTTWQMPDTDDFMAQIRPKLDVK